MSAIVYVEATPEELDSAYDYLMNEARGLSADLTMARDMATTSYVYAAATYEELVRTRDSCQLVLVFCASLLLALLCTCARRRLVVDEAPPVVVAAPVADVEAKVVKEDTVPV